MVGVSSRSVYRALEQEQPPTRASQHWTHHIADPYVSYLTRRWNEGCHKARELYEEIVAQGYTGSLRGIERIVAQFRPHGAKPVTNQTIIWQKAPSPPNAALMIVRPAEKRTEAQTTFIDQLCKSDAKASTAVRASGIAELIDFMEGLADDAEAIVNGCSECWNNSMTEGFVNKVKWIKRSSYGQAGFPLLQRRVLLHPTTREIHHPEKMLSACAGIKRAS